MWSRIVTTHTYACVIVDRTAKVWDLTTGEEFVTLDDHPNNVTAVRYSEDTGLVYTVSAYFVKVWDIRQGRKCVKTLL